MKQWAWWGCLALVSGFSSVDAQAETRAAVFGGVGWANFLSLSGHAGAELNFEAARGLGLRLRGLGELSSVGNARGTALSLDGLLTFEATILGSPLRYYIGPSLNFVNYSVDTGPTSGVGLGMVLGSESMISSSAAFYFETANHVSLGSGLEGTDLLLRVGFKYFL